MKSKTKKKKVVVSEGVPDIAANGISGNRVMIGISKTINIDNYESFKVEYAECRVVQDGEDFKKVRKRLKKRVWFNIRKMIKVVEDNE